MKHTFLLIFILLSFSTIHAQLDFLNHTISDQSIGIDNNHDVIPVDLDGDGDIDLISCAEKLIWQENLDGKGSFSNNKMLDQDMQFAQCIVKDIDRDGDIDIVAATQHPYTVANPISYLKWYENDGHGNFIIHLVYGIEYPYLKAAVSDLDGDGDLDITAKSYDIFWFENTNKLGEFSEKKIIATQSFTSPNFIVGDFDKNGFDEILTTQSFSDRVELISIKNTNGNFGTPQKINEFKPYVGSLDIQHFHVVDMDNDDDMDLVLSNGLQFIWMKNTNGKFLQREKVKLQDVVTTLNVTDIDSDGDIDIIYATLPYLYSNTIGILVNENGSFLHQNHNIIRKTRQIIGLSSTDIDADGKLDILITDEIISPLAWYKNMDNQGIFSQKRIISKFSKTPEIPKYADLDSDGNLDIIVKYNKAIVWYKNNNGVFEKGKQNIISDLVSGSFTNMDVDGDGEMDILASVSNDIVWFKNIGNGVFEDAKIIDSLIYDSYFSVADLNNDNRDDIINFKATNSNDYAITWYENEGNGVFSRSKILRSGEVSHPILKDIDHDGDIDLCYQGRDEMHWIANQGDGDFDTDDHSNNKYYTSLIDIADFNGDGDFDVLVYSDKKEKVVWMENLENFTSFSEFRPISSNKFALFSAKDLDNDGDIDIIEATDHKILWHENLDGLGNFGLPTILTNNQSKIKGMEIADFNQDGKLDIICTDIAGNQDVSLYENRGLKFNKIKGIIRYDLNGNGCDQNDLLMQNIKVTTNNSTENLSTFTSENGYYQLYPSTAGEYKTQITSLLPDYFTFTPDVQKTNFEGISNIENIDFCIGSNKTVNDLSIVLFPHSDIRPGFLVKYLVACHNFGTTPQNAIVTFQFDNSKLKYTYGSETNISTEDHTLKFDLGTLNPLETKFINLRFTAFAPPITANGDILETIAIIKPISNDATPKDNIFNIKQTVIGSYDPNDIAVVEGKTIKFDKKDDYLHYVIRFQNTGTADAINIVVTNDLDPKLDGETMQLEYVSHPVTVQIKDNHQIFFDFENIHLADSTANEALSHGYIAYKIKPKSNIKMGDMVSNNAQIYFDFNPAINTNIVHTTFIQPTSTDPINKDGRFYIHPNPTQGLIYIHSETSIHKLQIYNNLGVLVKENFSQNKIDISEMSSGLYILQIEDNKGRFETSKVIRF